MSGIICDAEALSSYNGTLKKNFNSIVTSLDNIERTFKTMYDASNWKSDTGNYFSSECKKLLSNFETVKNKFDNINQYLESVVSNVKSTDASTSAAFDAFSKFKF